MIVVDTHILIYATLRGPNAALAEGVHERDADWAAPRLWRSEFLNVAAGFARRGEASWAFVGDAFSAAAGLIGDRSFESDPAAVLALAAQTRLTAYDLEFVALAKRLAVPLVTFDKQVLEAFPGTALSPRAFIDRA